MRACAMQVEVDRLERVVVWGGWGGVVCGVGGGAIVRWNANTLKTAVQSPKCAGAGMLAAPVIPSCAGTPGEGEGE